MRRIGSFFGGGDKEKDAKVAVAAQAAAVARVGEEEDGPQVFISSILLFVLV
jgi:hypothetical protein